VVIRFSQANTSAMAEETSIEQISHGPYSPPINGVHGNLNIIYGQNTPYKQDHISILNFNIERRYNKKFDPDELLHTNEIEEAQFILSAYISIYNDTNLATEECQVIWIPPTRKGYEIIDEVTSKHFGLTPKERRDITLSVQSMFRCAAWIGEKCTNSSLKVKCNNNIVSDTISRNSDEVITK
jgi:hypothetical protein